MDGTLYSNPAYLKWQESSQVARLAERLGIDVAEAVEMMRAAREARRAAGLPATSMGNLFKGFGIGLADIVSWREEDFRPAEWLLPDQNLNQALSILSRKYRLSLLTNNPKKIGIASLEVLGIASHFKTVIGLDDTGESKPSHRPFERVCESMGLKPQECVSIGDRTDVDIEPALAIGMGAILVSGVEEVYSLPAFFGG
jgi:phosphoglycolate phosphatase/putative hydrolase of the HAD superfamily